MTPSRIGGPLSDALASAYVGHEFPVVTILAAYFDDSRSHSTLAVAGYVSSVECWDDLFVPEWSRLLTDAWPSKVSEFKAADCRHGTGEFRGWPQTDRDRLTRRAVEVIVGAIPEGDITGLGAAVSLPPAPNPTMQKKMLEFAYFLSFGIIIRQALALTQRRLRDHGDTIQFVFDSQKGLEGRTYEIFETARSSLGSELHDGVERPIFRDSKKVLPIQAADLLAYETYKEVKNRRESRAASRALRALLAGRFHHADHYDEEATTAAINWGLRGKPEAEAPFGKVPVPVLYRSDRPLRGDGG